MPLFTLTCRDVPDSGALRGPNRPEHLEYLWSRDADIVVAGALMDPEGETPIGSHFVLDLSDVAAVEAFADGDPYARVGVFASREITRYRLAPPPPGSEPV